MSPQQPWYANAVFYELRVDAFRDGNGDGYGDFAGLADRLDYLDWLGVNALWLTPFYRSPWRDGGYDVADFCAIDPRFGTMDDFRQFISVAHDHAIHVVIDLVLNHTSDQHPWFQDARRPGSDHRDWYLWSDDPDRFGDVPIIFRDVEESNWAWDEVAGAHYWHRFYSHQPDLNYDHPPVAEAMLDVVRFWLAEGVDGFRLDAVPYLFEREGTNCAGLPETHAFLRRVRSVVDEAERDVVLLAEANEPMETLRPYFGDGDACHMAFHFPLMPRLFLALAKQDHRPLTELVAKQPTLPPGCSWATFLRNHDELTLEQVTDEERRVLLEAYAPEPLMRLNLGIRRRLAPLLGHDERRILLAHAMLLSLPGTPFLYYGDELGLSDDVTLPDRDGVRTAMPWNGGEHAGFTDASPAIVVLPPDEVHVDAARRDEGSLLHGIRRLLAVRLAHPVLADAPCRILELGDPAVAAWVRQGNQGTIVALHNLGSTPRSTTLDPELGPTAVSVAGDGRLEPGGQVVLPGYGFLWLRLMD